LLKCVSAVLVVARLITPLSPFRSGRRQFLYKSSWSPLHHQLHQLRGTRDTRDQKSISTTSTNPCPQSRLRQPPSQILHHARNRLPQVRCVRERLVQDLRLLRCCEYLLTCFRFSSHAFPGWSPIPLFPSCIRKPRAYPPGMRAAVARMSCHDSRFSWGVHRRGQAETLFPSTVFISHNINTTTVNAIP